METWIKYVYGNILKYVPEQMMSELTQHFSLLKVLEGGLSLQPDGDFLMLAILWLKGQGSLKKSISSH